MRQITFDTFEDAIGAVGNFSDGLGCNVTITSEEIAREVYGVVSGGTVLTTPLDAA